MKKLLLALSAIVLAACGDKGDDIITPPDSQSQRLLTVKVSENPMQGENANAREMTRTEAATTTETLSTFRLNYGSSWYNDYKKSDSNWGTVNWPNVDSNTKIDFYAHDGGTFYYNDGNPYVNFTMDENAFSQKDLLVATHKQISYSESSGIVSLAFDHACAAVQFNVYKEENASYTVNSIILKNVKNAGSYYYDVTPHWQTTNGTADYTLTNSDITVTTDKKLLPCKWLFIIPQSKAGIQIEINYNGNKQKTLNLSGTWQAGTKYTVDIRIGKSA